MSATRTLLLLLLAVAARATPAAQPQGDAPPGGRLRILMLGNSYTAMTRGTLLELLVADPRADAELVARCPGGKTLAWHAGDAESARLIADATGWDVVVLQEQSQLPAFAMRAVGDDHRARDELDAGAPVLIRRIRESQPRARIVLFETWARHPGADKSGTLEAFGGDPVRMQQALTRGYLRMRSNPPQWDFAGIATIAPVGRAFEAWYEDHGQDDGWRLHRPDNSHPNRAGSLLAAAVLYHAITGRDPRKIDPAPDLGVAPDGRPLAKLIVARAGGPTGEVE